VKELSGRNFGILIAYVIPGMVLLLALSVHSPTIREWLGTPPSTSPHVAGFLYVTLASIALGMTASAIRFLTVDAVHHRTGIIRPSRNVRYLAEKLPAIEMLVEYEYRYYQFHSNMLIAVVLSYPLIRSESVKDLSLWSDAIVFLLMCVFTAASRDNLRNYYGRVAQLLGARESEASHEQRLASRIRSRSGKDSEAEGSLGSELAREGDDPEDI
jgi:hypothetical protein